MNSSRRLSFLAALALCSLALTARAQISLSLSQSSISNYFNGYITVTVTGLTNGESVFLERFVDMNGNNTVDAGDLLVCRVLLTDGGAPLIGNMRNVNAPGDDDGATNGTIQAAIAFSDTGGFDHFVGNYLMRVTSTTRGFSDTKPFAITNTPFAQTISGTVAGGANAAVALLTSSGQNQKLVLGVYTDAGGNYTAKVPVGNYTVVAAKPGSVFNFGTAPTISPTTGSTQNNVNPSLSSATTRTISGKVMDAATSAGLPAVLLRFQSADNLFTLAYTDTNGNYTVPVTASVWQPDMDEQGPLVQGYVTANNHNQTVTFDTTAGNVANANLALPKADALIYGFVRDAQSNGYPGLRMNVNDYGNRYDFGFFSITNGYYAVGVAGGTNWNVGFDSAALAAHNLAGNGTNLFLAVGQAVRADLLVQGVTAHLRGQVVDNLNSPLANYMLAVQIRTNGYLVGNTLYPLTDGAGNFDIGVFGAGGGNPVTWNVALECVTANTNNLVSFSTDFPVVDGVDQNGLKLVALHRTFVINGTARDTNNQPVTNVVFFANATINGTNYVVGCVTNDASGNFSLSAVNANWTVGVQNDQKDFIMRAFVVPANQNSTVNGGNGSVAFILNRFAEFRPSFSGPARSFNQFSATIGSLAPGAYYRTEYSTNLASAAWFPLLTNQSFSGSFQINDFNATNASRFYRVLLLTNYFGP